MPSFAPQQSRTHTPAPPAAVAAPSAKLSIGPVDDPLEHEAERVANAVMAGQHLPPLSKAASQRNEMSHSHRQAEAPSLVQNVLNSPGQPLDAATRAYFEPRFGRELSGVRVHRGGAAVSSSVMLGAHAYTVGQSIVFGGNHSADRNILTAHELAHTIQNEPNTAQHVVRRTPTNDTGLDVKIVSEVWDVDKRKVVIVEVNGQRSAFYQRSSSDNKGRAAGHLGPQAGDWAPFDGFSDDRTEAGTGKKMDGYFEKNKYWPDALKESKWYGYGNQKNRDISQWLKTNVDDTAKGKVASWQDVQQQLEKANVKVLKPLKPPERLTPTKPFKKVAPASNTERSEPDATRRGHIEYSKKTVGVASGKIVTGEIQDKKPPLPPTSGGNGPAGGGTKLDIPTKTVTPSTATSKSSGATTTHADVAHFMVQGQNAVARAQRFTLRLQGYLSAWDKLTVALSGLAAINSMTSLLAHGTAMPNEQHEADLVLQDSNDALEVADHAIEDISLFSWMVLVGEANRKSDEKTLWELDDILTKMVRSFELSGSSLKNLADGLAAQADDITVEMYKQFAEILRPNTSGTVDNAIAFAVYRSLELIHGAVHSASQNYMTASTAMTDWASQLKGIADLANGYAWDAAQKRAALSYQLDQAKNNRSVSPVVETEAEQQARGFLERLRNARP
jgi:Domain of unknown function (DUF4157)